MSNEYTLEYGKMSTDPRIVFTYDDTFLHERMICLEIDGCNYDFYLDTEELNHIFRWMIKLKEA